MTPHLTGDESMEDMLKQALQGLSGLSACAGLVVAPLAERAVKHIEFIAISKEKILVILVDDTNHVENRLIPRPRSLAPQNLSRQAIISTIACAGALWANCAATAKPKAPNWRGLWGN